MLAKINEYILVGFIFVAMFMPNCLPKSAGLPFGIW